MQLATLSLTPDTVGPVGRGHPWVYADGLVERERPPAGSPVRLLDPRGRPIAFGLADDGQIAVRILGRHPVDPADLIARTVAAAADLRRSVVATDTEAFRLVNGAGDGLPGLVVDIYGPVAVVRVYGACWVPWLDAIHQAVAACSSATTVVRRLGVRRVDGREGLDHLSGPPCPDTLVVREAGLRFLVRPASGQKTGLFLDQRENRRQIGRIAAGRDVLDVFSCSGGFAVHAAAGGARRVTVLDAAPAAIEDARENLRLNDIDPDRHHFVVADAFTWQPDQDYGVVVCDPPSLAHQKDADGRALRRYGELATRYGSAVSSEGLLAMASCTARVPWDRWEQKVREGLRRSGRWATLTRAGEPPDHPVLAEHPEGRYLKFALFVRRLDAALPRESGPLA